MEDYTETAVNGVKCPFCRSCFYFSQLKPSRVRANRFCFKGWNCRAHVSALNFTRFTTLSRLQICVVNKTHKWSNFGDQCVKQQGF